LLYEAMQKRGWRVFRNGWPDFLVLDKNTAKGCAIEFKAKGDQIRPAQTEMHAALQELGIPTHIVREDFVDGLKKARTGFFMASNLENLRKDVENTRHLLHIHLEAIAKIEEQLERASVIFQPPA
ncbi:MAG: VRR-NUC domain-containing protein, partial [Pirellulaceae bacterium]|nr:VRR-NUC domain-containing protein [Pirellulaceae bacterium]